MRTTAAAVDEALLQQLSCEPASCYAQSQHEQPQPPRRAASECEAAVASCALAIFGRPALVVSKATVAQHRAVLRLASDGAVSCQRHAARAPSDAIVAVNAAAKRSSSNRNTHKLVNSSNHVDDINNNDNDNGSNDNGNVNDNHAHETEQYDGAPSDELSMVAPGELLSCVTLQTNSRH